MVLEAIDRATGPMRRARASMAEQVRGIGAVRRAAQQSVAPARRLQTVNHALAGSFARAGSAAKRWAGKAGIGSWGDAAEMAGRGVGGLLRRLGGLAMGIGKWAGAAAVGAGSFALFDLFSTAGQFEQFQIMLEGTMGSAKKGQEAFGWIKRFAAETPFELAKVTESFLILKNAGLDPTKGGLAAAGDAASGMSRDITQAAEAMADAMTGEFERLKELGITANVAGERVRLTWIKNEKEISKVVSKADKVGLAMAVAAAWSDKFAGSTKRQSTTFFGLISNIKDKWSEFQVMVAEAGIFDLVKNKLQSILNKINEWAKNGQLKAWAEWLSQKLEDAFNWATSFTQADFQKVVSAMQDIVSAAQALATVINSIAWFFRESSFEKRINSALWGGGAPAPAKPTYRFPLQAPTVPIPSLLRKGAAAAPVTLPGFAQPRGRQAANDVSGLIRLQVEAKPGTSVRTTAIEGGNARVPLRVDLGRTMVGAA